MNDVIKRAREMVEAKAPFLHLGRDANGIDCVGLLMYAYQYPQSDVPAYPRDPHKGAIDRELERIFGLPLQTAVVERGGLCTSPIDARQLREGDVVSMQYRGPSRHVGIIANHPTLPGELSLIHTDSMVERATEHRLDEMWINRIVKVYRWSAK